MEIKKIIPDEKIVYNKMVNVKVAGNVIEIRQSTDYFGCPILKLNKDTYLVKSTGEVKEILHSEQRIEDVSSLRQSMKNLRDIINANSEHPDKIRFVTLTYAENMTNTKKLYTDLKAFIQRLRYHFNKYKIEYIICIEPQERGAWHAHILFIFDSKPPFIPNEKLSELWGNGYVSISKVDGINDLGLYLTSYLTSTPTDISISTINNDGNIKMLQTFDKNGNVNFVPKKIQKGARLELYPKGMRFFRVSKGIKRPIEMKCTHQKALEIVEERGLSLVYEKTIVLSEPSKDFERIINYKQFKKPINKK